MNRRFALLLSILSILPAVVLLFLVGCGLFAGETPIDEGIVISPAKVRSSTAPVALDIVEVKRGDRLDILDQAEVKTPTRVEEWYRVRTRGKDPVTGWIDARSVINKSIVSKIEEIYDKTKSIISQGKGRLKVRTPLRVEPDGEVVTRLSRGTEVEIVGKTRTTIKPQRQAEDNADEESDEPEERTVLWYQIRLPETEVLRAGWVGAQQVQLDVPEEILHLEGEGRRFTGWVVYDQTKARDGELKNNYIGLMKSLTSELPVDFTRIWVLVYDPGSGRYNGAYIEDSLRGMLPITLGTSRGSRGFTIHELDENGKIVPVEYDATREGASRLVVRRISPKIFVKKQPRSVR
ncbi:MAG TPA: hypothetical protein VID27_19560 [Blastocatellia bacterium]|jgi:hypothetical protein